MKLITNGLERSLAELLLQQSQVRSFQQGETLFREQDICEYFILLVSGSIKVRKLISDGHEIVLYRIASGQECNLSSSCLLGGQRYLAEAVAEIPCEVLLISRERFLQPIKHQPKFSALVFSNIDHGMSKLLDLIQELAFGHMDHRLALALDLGTAREVTRNPD